MNTVFDAILCRCFSHLKLIQTEINPHVERWEKEQQFPAHEVFRKLGKAGFLGVNKPVGELCCCSVLNEGSSQKLMEDQIN